MKKKHWKIGLGIFFGLLLIALIIAPVIVKKQAVKRSKELIGRQISLSKLRINYFTSTVRFIDFHLYEADEEQVFVSFDTLLVNLAPLKLIRKNLVIQQLYLKGLTTHIVQYDSVFNFTDLVEFHQAKTDSSVMEVDTSASEPFRFDFSKLELNQAHFSYTDASIEHTIHLEDFSFYTPHIAWNQEDKSDARIKFNFQEEGYFQTTLNVDPTEGEFNAQISIQSLHLNGFSDFLRKTLPIDSVIGVVNSEFFLEGDLDELEKSIISGSVDLFDFKLTNQEQQKLIGLNEMNLTVNEIDMDAKRLNFNSLAFIQPYLYFELYDSSNNIFEFFGLESDTTTEDSEESVLQADSPGADAAAPFFFSLNSFSIDQGIIDYSDNRTGEPFEYHLSELNLKADSLSSQDDWIDLYSQMKLNHRGKLNAELGLNPQDPMNMSLNIAISDFLLSDLNIYSRYYLGSPILKGDMYYKSKTTISGGQLASDNKLVMENVELGEKKGGLHDLPLKFALFLLKDRNGVIDLDVPVGGDLKDPKIRLGKIIWNTIKNLIVKTATAPYDLLANSLGVDPKDIQNIEFAYTDTLLTDQMKQQLDLLLILEEKKEGLGIELVYYSDLEKEIEQLSLAFYEQTVPSETPIDSTALYQHYAELAGLFKQKRVSLVSDYLKIMNDSTGIVTSISHPEAPGNVGSIPRFEVEYSMSEYHEGDPDKE